MGVFVFLIKIELFSKTAQRIYSRDYNITVRSLLDKLINFKLQTPSKSRE